MKSTRFLVITAALALCMGAIPASSYGTGAQANIKIEQLSPGVPGVWTMLSSTEALRKSTDEGVNPLDYSFGVTDYGPTTLSVSPPPGMTVRITAYRGGEKVGQTDSQQYSFTLVANDNYRFVLQYALAKLGSLGITSEPSGVRFRIRGPGGRTRAAETPVTLENLPVGRYTVMFPGVNGCTDATRQNAIVEAETRNTLHVTLANCEATTSTDAVDNSRVSKRTLREQAEQREFKPRGERK